jgi:hypothetical protein
MVGRQEDRRAQQLLRYLLVYHRVPARQVVRLAEYHSSLGEPASHNRRFYGGAGHLLTILFSSILRKKKIHRLKWIFYYLKI